MAVHKGREAFEAFKAGVLAKIPDPTQRAAAEAALNSVTSIEPVAAALYDGVAGQSAISTQMAELAAQREQLTARQAELDQRDTALDQWRQDLGTWYQGAKERVAAQAKPDLTKPTPPAPTAPTLPDNVVTHDQAQEVVARQNAAFLGFQRDQNRLMREHYARFNEILDLEPLIQHPRIAELALTGVYELVHKDRLAQHDAAKKTAAEEAIRADERSKVLAQQAQMPYPAPTGAGSGSPLDALTVGKPDALVDTATAHYNRLQQERMAGAGAGR